MYEYFYGEEAEQFSFYRIPKVFFTDDTFLVLSAEAKILYGILLDRMSLSVKNNWLDDENRVFIIYTIEEIMRSLNCANQKAMKIISELENFGLVERKRQGLGKPSITYVKNFIRGSKSHFKNNENHYSRDVKIISQEVLKSHTNNTDINNTDYSDTDNKSFNSFLSERGNEGERETYRTLIKDNIEYDILLERNSGSTDDIDEMVELMVDTVCSKKPYIRVGGDNKPQAVVKSQLLKLNSEHIAFCIDCLKENTTDVKNIRQYLLTTLYNAPLTISNYYGLKVQHDMAYGR